MTHGKASMVVTIKIEGREVEYTVRPLFPLGMSVRSFELRKRSGDKAVYRVWESSAGTNCNCEDNLRNKGHNGLGCKHIRVLRSFGMVE